MARRILRVTNGQAANIVTGNSNQPKSWSCLHIVCEAAVLDVLASGHSGIPPISVADMIEELIPFMGRAEIAWKIKGGKLGTFMHMLVAHAPSVMVRRVLQAVRASHGVDFLETLLNIQDKDGAGGIDRAYGSSVAVGRMIKDEFGGIEQRTPEQAEEINRQNQAKK